MPKTEQRDTTQEPRFYSGLKAGKDSKAQVFGGARGPVAVDTDLRSRSAFEFSALAPKPQSLNPMIQEETCWSEASTYIGPRV